ncbi:energy transducer TonB [Solirubrum puertoriconensis]|uniref:TonB C-terminal domain-containing protein n=1 Tax=Solirubrum puertoriconensis TaxID=1751427 RepID=A0A9X0HL36_SOLP1|nr:energy transducer TonB [Solirubrum puertoriconensis]KUG07928.1 hypothetical protein ASU33_06880 [Solirubrum puertoriconensis]
MLHALPITNVRLQPCAVAADKLTAVVGGHFCSDCQRVVHDFTNATQLELAEARAASPDGRLCGRFQQTQLATTPMLRPKLRWFLAALVLVVVQGLSAQQAWAQVKTASRVARIPQHTHQDDFEISGIVAGGIAAEQMPRFKGGMQALVTYLKANTRYPATTAEGRVFVHFIVARNGSIRGATVTKGCNPLLDAEALRVIRQMPAWEPAKHNGQPVDMAYTIPITFSRPPASSSKRTP